MIVSISRRTDIPACYFPWFLRRLEEGFVYARNPMRFHQVSRISLRPEDVDGFVFWTKNPLPMLAHLERLQEYAYYVQFTLTAYGPDLEPGLPDKDSVLIPAFQELARRIGPERVIWRYDPILLTERYTVEAHLRRFEEIACRLEGCTRRCVISFLDMYRHLQGPAQALGMRAPTEEEARCLAGSLAGAARARGISLQTCAEAGDYTAQGVTRGACIDTALLSRIAGREIAMPRDRHQRPGCGCAASVDIGQYDTCPHGCRYCYAVHSNGALRRGLQAHNPLSPLLCGELTPEDTVCDRR